MTWKEPAIVVASGGTTIGGVLQILGPGDAARTNVSFPNGITRSQRTLVGLRRNGQGAAGYVEDNLQDVPGFHDLLDPNTPRRNRGFELRDFILTIQAVGANNFAWGIHDLLTVNDWTSLVGVGFEHGPDNVWKTFLKDAPANALPPRVLRQVVTVHLANVIHELAIIFDGWTKTITWLVDGIAVDSFQMFQPIDQTGGTAAVVMQKLRYRGLVPAAGDFTFHRYGGGVSTPILTLREFP